MMEKIKSGRRSFFKTSALGALGTIGIPAFVGGCSQSSSKNEKFRDYVAPELRSKAVDGKPLKAGLVGCGDRGAGAAFDFISAGDDLQITAIGDVFKERVDNSAARLRERGQNIPEESCFSGLDAYKKVIDSDVDVVLLCTPPVFRPLHFEYAINAGKHCFIEKPVAVDSVGARQMLISGRQAAQHNLSVISGTIRRSEKNCIELCKLVADGAIGKPVSAHVIRHGGNLWHRNRESGWCDMEYMMRNWVNFAWISGDLICEQFIHEVDLMQMFIGDVPPTRALATGGRARRLTGDVYDFFSVEYEYEGSFRAHCTSRQIAGCDNKNEVLVYGTKGYTDCRNWIRSLDNTDLYLYQRPPADERTTEWNNLHNGLIQEHILLVSAIRTGKTINDVEAQTLSTIMGIMGREAAYTGKFITYEQMLTSNQKLGPEKIEFGPVPEIVEEIKLPGVAARG